MDYLRENYGAAYAPNTRETFRRQVLHQFVQGRIADYNPFEPDLPTNNPRAHYAITQAALDTVRRYGTDGWGAAVARFRREQGALCGTLRARPEPAIRFRSRCPTGRRLRPLSGAQHNEVQKAVIEEFAPRFAQGARLLYLGDTARKDLVVDRAGLAELGIQYLIDRAKRVTWRRDGNEDPLLKYGDENIDPLSFFYTLASKNTGTEARNRVYASIAKTFDMTIEIDPRLRRCVHISYAASNQYSFSQRRRQGQSIVALDVIPGCCFGN